MFSNSLNDEEKRQFVRDILDGYPSPPTSSRFKLLNGEKPISSNLQLKDVTFSVSSSMTIVEVFHQFLKNDKCIKCKKGFGKDRNIYRCLFCNYTMHVICIENLEFKCYCK